MSGLISRQDVLALAKDVILINGAKHRCIDATQIHELPSAERTGKWTYKTTDAYIQRTCSACGWSERIYHRNRNQDGLTRHYCPNCGHRNEVRKNEDVRESD